MITSTMSIHGGSRKKVRHNYFWEPQKAQCPDMVAAGRKGGITTAGSPRKVHGTRSSASQCRLASRGMADTLTLIHQKPVANHQSLTWRERTRRLLRGMSHR